jgi:hypothetical protein
MTKKNAALVCLAWLAGCYNTQKVQNGGLVCGQNDTCPDGFSCVKDGLPGQPGHCWKNGTGPADASTNVPKPDASTNVPKPDVAPPVACTVATGKFGPFASCVPELPGTGSTCDPVCQSGCPCEHRCVVNQDTWGSFVCEATAPAPSSFVPIQGDCTDPREADCEPGSICIADRFCPWFCYKTCRKDTDCPRDSRCSVNTLLDKNMKPVTGVFLCTPPIETCNPTGTAACASPRENFSCFFLAGQTGVASDSTICDCKTLHDKGLGAACAIQPDDCAPGMICIDQTCRQLCERQASGSGSGCPTGSGCTPVYGSAKFGYCR